MGKGAANYRTMYTFLDVKSHPLHVRFVSHIQKTMYCFEDQNLRTGWRKSFENTVFSGTMAPGDLLFRRCRKAEFSFSCIAHMILIPGRRFGGLNCIALTKKTVCLPLAEGIKYNKHEKESFRIYSIGYRRYI